MRVTTIFLLLAVVVFHTRGDGEADESAKEADESAGESESDSDSGSEGEDEQGTEPDCEQYKQQTCPKKDDPVCGTNKKKYDNECELCLENRKKKTNVKILKDEECENE